MASTTTKKRALAFNTIISLIVIGTIWMWLEAFVAIQGEDKTNFTSEIVATLVFGWFGYLAYSKVYLDPRLAQRAAEKEKKEKDRTSAEQQQTQEQRFQKLAKDFVNTSSSEFKIQLCGQLADFALNSPFKRQECVNYLCRTNEWMKKNETFLLSQDLYTWRIKQKTFEVSKEFLVDKASQLVSMNSLYFLEKIIQKQAEEFTQNTALPTLSLQGKFLPALNLSNTHFPSKSFLWHKARFWKCHFWESQMTNLDLSGVDFRGASFWKAHLDNSNVANANFKEATLKTDLSECHSLSSEQFFDTEDWDQCLLTENQVKEFFPVQDNTNSQWEKWSLGETSRKKLFPKKPA